MCPQFHFSKDVAYGTEDCLYLNIYVPRAQTGRLEASDPLAVMFWIYGGGALNVPP